MAPTRRAWLAAAGALALAACGRREQRAAALPPGAPVLALGDSLTFGTGAAPEAAYPAELARLTGWTVVNAGVPGDTSADVLARAPALLQQHGPALVLLGAGGNDFLRRQPEAATRANLTAIVTACRGAGAQVLLIAVPRPSAAAAAFGALTDHALYGELAESLGLPLLRQAWAEVLGDAALRSDAIHANAAGYAEFARRLQATARAVGWLPR